MVRTKSKFHISGFPESIKFKIQPLCNGFSHTYLDQYSRNIFINIVFPKPDWVVWFSIFELAPFSSFIKFNYKHQLWEVGSSYDPNYVKLISDSFFKFTQTHFHGLITFSRKRPSCVSRSHLHTNIWLSMSFSKHLENCFKSQNSRQKKTNSWE